MENSTINSQKNLFKPIKRKRTFEEISSEIKKLIFNGTIKAGDRLPSEAELASQFNVGRQTVREALRLLELSGFITIQKGSVGGSFVQDTVLNTITNSFIDAFLLKKISIEELTTARLEIERLVLNFAIENFDNADIEALQKNILKAKSKLSNNIQAFSENVEFHKLMAKASKNKVFVIVVESIMTVVADFLSKYEPNIEKSNSVVRYHEEILNKMISGDFEGANTLLEKHINEVSTWL